ncbi:hypothetical protein LJC60_02700 [Ruminococcaceae bacterium OttesenSCG-928-D13]|nr:hypothetical protein [Ruminococcaceae bacterium OttesenSCG-928-D13]
MNDWQRTDLAGEWQLCHISHDDFVPGEAPTTLEGMAGYGESGLVGRVPGNFELDLERAGKLPDLFFGTNALLAQRYESTHVFYGRSFVAAPPAGTHPRLVFEGLDTVAEVYLNGRQVAWCENMFVPLEVELDALKEGENQLVVHFWPACVYARRYPVSAGNTAAKYNFESFRLRKAAHMFAWDIMPRIVSCGIYRPVYLEYRPLPRLTQVYLATTQVDVRRRTAQLQLFYEADIPEGELAAYRIEIEGHCGSHAFSAGDRLWFTAGKLKFTAEDALLWWPKGSGEAHLYDVTVTLKKEGRVVDSYRLRAGLRTVELVRSSTTDAFFGGKFHFTVNGRRVFILGTNFVPLDAFHSRDAQRLPQVCELLEDVGCNAIRCWGGNLYEEEALYDFCDEKGILVWQDFMMACAVYPNDDDFGWVMEQEVRTVVRRLRNHPSILVWAGDNEDDMFATFEPFGVDPNRNSITREFIPRVLAYEDPSRPYLPSSPYIDTEGAKVPMEYLTEHHLWGPRDYFRSEYYTGSVCNFASEIGYHGCPSAASVYEFMPRDEAWPWDNNPHWSVHAACPETQMDGTYGGRVRLMANQIKEMFGQVPDNLEDFALASQISQAEAMKFFVELFRTGRWDRTGIIWWNLIDGWPQFSDAVVDYFFRKKLAYHYVKQAQGPVLLAFAPPKDWALRLMAVNDTGRELEICYRVEDYENGSTLLEGTAAVGEDVFCLGQLAYSHGEKKLYRIHWEYEGNSGVSHYLCGNPPFDLEWYRNFLTETYGYTGWKA